MLRVVGLCLNKSYNLKILHHIINCSVYKIIWHKSLNFLLKNWGNNSTKNSSFICQKLGAKPLVLTLNKGFLMINKHFSKTTKDVWSKESQCGIILLNILLSFFNNRNLYIPHERKWNDRDSFLAFIEMGNISIICQGKGRKVSK